MQTMDAILTDYYIEHFTLLVSAGESLHHLTRKEAERSPRHPRCVSESKNPSR
jgi:hypothetical protein